MMLNDESVIRVIIGLGNDLSHVWHHSDAVINEDKLGKRTTRKHLAYWNQHRIGQTAQYSELLQIFFLIHIPYL